MLSLEELDLVHDALNVVMLRLATELEKADIPYWLDFGTCLGSIREQNFIPWDDDIDLALLRSDVPRFTQLILEELGNLVDLSLQSPEKPIAAPIKLELKGFHSIEERMASKGVPNWLHPNIGINIFLIDPRKRKPNWILSFYRRLLAKSWQAVQIFQWIGLNSTVPLSSKRKVKYFIAGAIPRSLLQNLINQEIQANCSLEESRFLLHGVDCEFANLTHDTRIVFPLQKTLFREDNFMIPLEAHTYLSGIYGPDFMQPPIVSRRLSHSSQLLIASDSPLIKLS